MLNRSLLVLAIVAVAACESDRLTSPAASPVARVPVGAVQIVIQQEATLGGDSAVFVVRVVANNVPLAAYQGRVTFTPGAMTVLATRTPEDSKGEFHIVNAELSSTGVIRFAGFAPEALTSTEAFRIVARLQGPVSALKLQGSLDVAGEASGTPIATTSLLRNTGIYDARTNLQLAP